jgi:hypothetical protein
MLQIIGKLKITTTKAQLTLNGTSANAAKVQVKVSKTAYKTATGLANWRFVATHLKRGKTPILVRAVSSKDTFSKIVKVTVIRK